MTIESALLVVACGMAVYRVSYLVTKEHGPFDVFKGIRDVLKRVANRAQATGRLAGLAVTVTELFHCPLCFGVWLSLIAAALLFRDMWLLAWLTIAGVQVFAERVSK
jgi:Flp pilus assembly protein TadB